MATGRIRAAKLENSKRLQRFLKVLQQAKHPVSTRTLQMSADCCNAHTAAAELREQGFLISVEQKGRVFFYSLLGVEIREVSNG